MGKNTVLEPQLHSNIADYDGNFCHSEKLIGAMLCIFENLRVRSQGHQIREYGQNLKVKSYGHNMTKYGTEYCFWSHD